MNPIEYLGVVELVDDVPALGLRAGRCGTVMELMAPDAYLVEFVDEYGQTTVMEEFSSNQLRGVETRPGTTTTSMDRAKSHAD